ncbi:MAG TPA: sulfatase-like hydrolase/transferase [Methylomirabilota bacterium]|nr:sulfatase-like hydrolase/transferase [Methylomirabilota bacterium]
MKSIYFSHLRPALVALAIFFGISADAQSFVFSNTTPQAVPRRASIILIVADGLGYGDLSCYGQTKFQTPNLDKLAAEGIRFTNYSGETENSESQAELMFGKNSADNELTVAQILKNSGYHTGLIGEWTLGDENSALAPWKKGFDEFAGYLDADAVKNFYADYIFRYAPKSIYDETNKQFTTFSGREMIYPNTLGKKTQFIPDLFTKAALNFVKNNQPDQFNRYRPFFLLLNYQIPGDGTGRAPSDAPFSEESWPQPEKNKAALISRLDGYVGELREQLEKLAMTNNVAIFFTSDAISKKASGVDPDFFHSNIATNDFRVPMIVHWPGNVSAGRVSRLRWSAQDFAPTAVQIAYAKPATNFVGISILPVLISQPGTNTSVLPDSRNPEF